MTVKKIHVHRVSCCLSCWWGHGDVFWADISPGYYFSMGVKHISVGYFMLLENLQLHHLGIWHHLGCESLCLCFGVPRDVRLLCRAVFASRKKKKVQIKRELSSLDQFYEECKTSLGHLRVSCTYGASWTHVLLLLVWNVRVWANENKEGGLTDTDFIFWDSSWPF